MTVQLEICRLIVLRVSHLWLPQCLVVLVVKVVLCLPIIIWFKFRPSCAPSNSLRQTTGLTLWQVHYENNVLIIPVVIDVNAMP